MLHAFGKRTADGGFNWSDAFADAVIMAALTGFTSLTGMTIVQVVIEKAWFAASIAAAVQFFAILAMKRGIVQQRD